MTGYANKKHVKQITAELYINGKNIDKSSGSKITSVGNEYMLVITRDEFPPNENHCIEIVLDGYMHTEFVVDGLMRDKVKKTISVYVEPKLIIPVKQSNLKVLEKNELDWVVRPLAQTYETSSESVGFTEAGKYIIAKLELNVEKSKINNVRVSIDDNRLITYEIFNTKKDLAIKVQIPKNLATTLYGEYSLRQKEESYFLLSRNDIGTRKDRPHILKIEFEIDGKEYVHEIKFDTLDTYLSNVNTRLGKSTNYDGMLEDLYVKLEEWIELKNEQ